MNKNKQRKKRLREGVRVREPVIFHTENPAKTKLAAIIYTQRTWCRPMQALCMLPPSLRVHMSFGCASLEGLVSLVSSVSSGSYVLSSLGFPDL